MCIFADQLQQLFAEVALADDEIHFFHPLSPGLISQDGQGELQHFGQLFVGALAGRTSGGELVQEAGLEGMEEGQPGVLLQGQLDGPGSRFFTARPAANGAEDVVAFLVIHEGL